MKEQQKLTKEQQEAIDKSAVVFVDGSGLMLFTYDEWNKREEDEEWLTIGKINLNKKYVIYTKEPKSPLAV